LGKKSVPLAERERLLHDPLVGLLFFGTLAFALSFNALWPRRAPAELAAASFFAGWLTAELAFHVLLWQAAVVALFIYGGALHDWPGEVGLGLSLGAAMLLLASLRLSARSRMAVEGALVDLPTEARRGFEWTQLLMPIPVTHRRVERQGDVIYYDDGKVKLRLDVWRRRGPRSERAPALIYVHGGGWVIGDKRYQGLPTLQRLASCGWVCFSIQYRLSPRATFPDHIIDVKRAIAWVRAHAAEYGADPDFIAVAGGSAGAHLASLAALTPNRAEWQPGFESANTTVQLCIAYYGVYDFVNRFGHWRTPGLKRLLERYVFKTRIDEARQQFELASPISHIGPHAPPFLIVHGTHDTLVPVAEARAFFNALSAESEAACVYIEVPGAQHAFEIFPSLRTIALLDGVERFASHVHARRSSRVAA
jgi:acetyl esterase/lipase